MLREWLPHLQDQARDGYENMSPADSSNSADNQLLSEGSSTKQSGKIIGFSCNYSAEYSLLSFPVTCWLERSL